MPVATMKRTSGQCPTKIVPPLNAFDQWVLAATTIGKGPLLYYAAARSKSVALTATKDNAVKFKSKGKAIGLANELYDTISGDHFVPFKAVPYV